MAQRARPIPKPTHFPGVIYHSKRQDVITLQDQMCLGDDTMTFLEFTRLMKQTMDDHLNIGMSYKWQDPGLLEEVREEVLVQCPALEERYDDAWPITSYLRVSLRQRAETYRKRTTGRKSRSKYSQTNIDGSVVSRRLVLGRLTQEIPASVGSSSKGALRRSTRLTKRDEGIIELTEVEMARGDEAAEELEDEQDGTSFRDQRAENADHEAGSNSVSDSEGSMPLHLSRESLGSGCTSKTQEDNREHARQSLPSNCPRSSRHAPDRARSLSPNPDLPSASPTLSTEGTTHDAAPGAERFYDGLGFGSSSYASRISTPQPSDIENMLLSRGLPLADSRHITLLLSSLGIVDKTYLRVFARLAASREAWLSEMRLKGQLSEVQAWVIVDVLDTVVMD